MARHKSDDLQVDTGRWLSTYADMMNNLLVLFIALYCISIVDLNKFKSMAKGFQQAFSGGSNYSSQTAAPVAESSSTPPENVVNTEKAFDDLYEELNKGLQEQGYSEAVVIEKEDGLIHIRFRDSVLFYPDSPMMKNDGLPVLQFVGTTIERVDYLIEDINISGHTARIGEDSSTNFFAWELSSDRAVTVLKYLVQSCGLPQSKMIVMGCSHYDPVGSDDTEEGRAVNRRVEIRITRIPEETVTQTTQPNKP